MSGGGGAPAAVTAVGRLVTTKAANRPDVVSWGFPITMTLMPVFVAQCHVFRQDRYFLFVKLKNGCNDNRINF